MLINTTILMTSLDTLSITPKGQIIWTVDNKTSPIAQLIKGSTVTTPEIKLLSTEPIMAEDAKKITKHLQTWLNGHIQTILEPLFSLENLEITGAAKGISFQLFEKFGFLYRKDVLGLIKELSKEDRQFLSKRGVRLGAYYVYQRDMLKPAAVNLRAALWLSHHGANELAITPPAGNVSMAVDKRAPKDFYRTIGFPIFGTTAVRMDMVERVNSAVFDGAKDGKYTFDPALASTIGVGVDALYLVLADLGFKYETITEEITTKDVKEAPEQKETRVYHLKKAPIKPHRQKRRTNQNKAAPESEKEPDPNSPFAALQGLIKK